jgi:hypothetical protein
MTDIKVSVPELEIDVTVQKNFGANLEESVDLFGEEVVHNTAVRQFKIGAQALVRAALKTKDSDGNVVPSNISQEDLQAKVDAWTPGVIQRSGKSKVERTAESIENMSEADRAELMEKLKASLAG